MSHIPLNVVDYYSHKYDVAMEEAVRLFAELDKFLRCASNSRQSPSRTIDEAWHVFILHTREYSDYCSSQFGCFVHHVPFPISSKGNIADCGKDCSSNCNSDPGNE